MRSTRYLKYCISVVFVVLMSASALFAGVVNLDLNAKTISADAKTLDPRIILTRNGQSAIGIFSTINDPQTFKLKVSGLIDKEYDIYLDKAFYGKYTTQALADGIDFQLPGCIFDENLIKCLSSIRVKVNSEYKRFIASKVPEEYRVGWTLGQVDDWVNSGLGRERIYRSAHLMIVPAGNMVMRVPIPTKLDAQTTATALTRACYWLQKARQTMSREIKNPDLRNAALATMTPVSFTAAYSINNGKPHIDAVLTNDCNLPISGNITMGLPKGWKANTKTLKFSDVKSGTKCDFSFDLIAPAKNAVALESVPIAANLTLTQDPYTASYKIKVVAANSPADVTK